MSHLRLLHAAWQLCAPPDSESYDQRSGALLGTLAELPNPAEIHRVLSHLARIDLLRADDGSSHQYADRVSDGSDPKGVAFEADADEDLQLEMLGDEPLSATTDFKITREFDGRDVSVLAVGLVERHPSWGTSVIIAARPYAEMTRAKLERPATPANRLGAWDGHGIYRIVLPALLFACTSRIRSLADMATAVEATVAEVRAAVAACDLPEGLSRLE